jgi:hypothetical protein
MAPPGAAGVPAFPLTIHLLVKPGHEGRIASGAASSVATASWGLMAHVFEEIDRKRQGDRTVSTTFYARQISLVDRSDGAVLASAVMRR